MRPSKQFVYELFDRQRRYVVPLFQRPYVWNRDEQWQPLWDDIEEKTVSILEQRSPYPHFLEQDLDRFWRDYALTNLRRGIFAVVRYASPLNRSRAAPALPYHRPRQGAPARA